MCGVLYLSVVFMGVCVRCCVLCVVYCVMCVCGSVLNGCIVLGCDVGGLVDCGEI